MHAVILSLSILLSLGAFAAEPFTAAELAQVQAIQITLENSCREQLKQKTQALPEDAPAVARWISRLAVSDDYCACTSSRFSENLTPAMLRHGTEEQGAALVKRSGTECVVPKLKSSFKEFCLDMISEIPGSAVFTEIAKADFCRCLQSDIDLISTESFETFVSNTIQDYRTYQQTQQVPIAARGTSLVSSMQHCGLDGLRPAK